MIHHYSDLVPRKQRLWASGGISSIIAYLFIDLISHNELYNFILIEILLLILVTISLSFVFESAKESEKSHGIALRAELYYETRFIITFNFSIGCAVFLCFFINQLFFLLAVSVLMLLTMAYVSYKKIVDRESNRYKFVKILERIDEEREKPYDYFISYSRDESLFASKLAQLLVDRGAKVWIDVNEIGFGDQIDENVISGIFQSKAFIVILSKSYFKKHYTMLEFNVIDELVDKDLMKKFVINYDMKNKELRQKIPDICSIYFYSLSDKATNIWYDLKGISDKILSIQI